MMNKNMNKRFFAEFLANLSLKVSSEKPFQKIIVYFGYLQVNPLPDENDDPEINIIKDSMNDDDENYVDMDENGEWLTF